MKKLHNDRGETLIEVLASIVIGSLSVALMFGCIMVSAKMDEDARDLDKKHYAGLTAADAQEAVPAPDDSEDPDGTGGSGDTGDPDDTGGSGDPGETDVPTVTITRVDPEGNEYSMEMDITIYGDAGMYSYSRSASTDGEGTP